MIPPLILIVNDDPQVLTLFSLLLRGEGYHTALYRQGTGAYTLIRQIQPTLVILDIAMERPDAGWQLLDELRRDPATQQLPVLIYSGQWDVAERVQERGDPRCGVLPIDTGLDALLLRVQQWLPIGG